MGKWTSEPLATTLADGDVVLMADVSEAAGSRDKRATMALLRQFLGAGITVAVTQASHGFSVGDVVYHDGTGYAQAKADTAAHAEAVGVVSSVPDTGTFAYQTAGVVSTLSGLTAGELYYLQDDGSLGTSAGTVTKAVLIATSTTTAVLVLAFATGMQAGSDAADLGSGTATDGQVLTADGSGGAAFEDLAPLQSFVIACSDETTDLTTGTGKVTFRMPYAFTVSEVRASVSTAPTGSALTVDINEAGSSILSTKLTIDAGEKTSETAATAAVISDSALADDAEVTIDIDQVGSSVAGAGLKVALIGTKT